MEHKQIIPTLMCRMRSRSTYSTKLNESRWIEVLWQQYSLQRKHSCKYLQNTPQQFRLVCVCACVREKARQRRMLFLTILSIISDNTNTGYESRGSVQRGQGHLQTPKYVFLLGRRKKQKMTYASNSQISKHMTVDYANIMPISARPSHFWDVMQRMLVVVYPRFGTAYSYQLQGPSSPRRTPGRWWILHRITHCIGSLNLYFRQLQSDPTLR